MSVDTRRGWIVGVDIGGTNLSAGLVSVEDGEVRGFRTRPTNAHGGADTVVRRVLELVEEATAEVLGEDRRGLLGVGVGSPGPLNRATGVVLETPNLGWRDFPLRDRIAEAVGLPATLDNDANCATYGEWWKGAGRGVDTLVGLTLGTGIGGGIVLSGELYHGASDVAGEIGHMTINYGGRRCACGNYGCLEAYASGPNIAARAVEGIRAGASSALVEMVDGDLDRVSARTVYEAALAKDRYARDILAETARMLGVGIASLVNVLNPEVVVVAGGVTRAGEHLFEPLREEVRRRSFRAASDVCRIVPAELPDTSGVVGAAAVFKRERFGKV